MIFETFQITVDEKTLTTEALKKEQGEKQEVSKLENFKKTSFRRNGTVQITIYEDMGYIKIWKDGKEENYKDLTKSEIKAIRKKLKIKN